MTADGKAGAGLVGRTEELGLLRTATGMVFDDRGGGIWIEGGPGLGKSRLLAEVFGPAWTPHPGTPAPLGTLLACLDPTARARPDVAAAGNLLRTMQSSSSPSRNTGPVLRQFRRACRNRPLTLVLDDLHRADEASLTVWSQLHRIVAASPLLLITATRPILHPSLDAAHALAISSGATAVNLIPLNNEQTTDLAYAYGHDPHVVNATVRDSGGNPAYLRLLSNGRGEPSPALCALVDEHLSTLSRRTRHTVTLLALTAPGATAIDLAVRSGRALADIRAELDEALHGAILTSCGGIIGFRHPIVRRVLRVPRRGRTHSPRARR